LKELKKSVEIGESAFFANEEKQDAVIHNFEVIGKPFKPTCLF
jgi:uncharacterized protein with HEPN domain